jgi:carbon-monoxide dehydrogenase small subunit
MSRVNVTVDGVAYQDEVEPRLLLVHYLRDRLGKVGTVIGCDTTNCGACTIHLDGRRVRGQRARRREPRRGAP